MSDSSIFRCGKCEVDFDEGARAPILLRACRHTFCRQCVEGLTAEARRVNLSFGRCPECDEQFFFTAQPGDFYKDFQRNADVYSKLLARQARGACPSHPSQKRGYVCLNPACAVKDRFCGECAKTHNPSCANKMTINEAAFSGMVRFQPGLKPTECFNKDALAAQIKSELQSLEGYLLSLLDAVEERFREDQARFERISADQEQFLRHKHLFAFKESPILTELTFEPRNGPLYAHFGAFVADLFGVRLWTDIHRAVNFGVLKFFDDKKTEAVLLFPECEAVVQRSAHVDPGLRNDLLLDNWVNGRAFHFDRFFSGIRAKLSGANVRFTEYDAKLFDKGMLYFAHKSIHRAFAQPVLTPAAITAAVAKDFNEEYKHGFFNFLNGNKNYTWQAALEFAPANRLRVGSKYVRLRSGRHELTIFTLE